MGSQAFPNSRRMSCRMLCLLFFVELAWVMKSFPLSTVQMLLNYLLGDDRSGAASAKRQQLILLDLNLPDMTGIDILQKLKGNKHTKRSPIVVLTTTDDSREIQRCYDLGANVYITKPVNYEGFANAIRQLGLFVAVMQVPETA